MISMTRLLVAAFSLAIAIALCAGLGVATHGDGSIPYQGYSSGM